MVVVVSVGSVDDADIINILVRDNSSTQQHYYGGK